MSRVALGGRGLVTTLSMAIEVAHREEGSLQRLLPILLPRNQPLQKSLQNSEFQMPAEQALEVNFKFMSSSGKRKFLPKATLNQGIDTPCDLASHQHGVSAENLN